MSDDEYRCQGPMFTSHQDAEVAMLTASVGRVLVRPPLTYVCYEGHIHYEIEEAPQ